MADRGAVCDPGIDLKVKDKKLYVQTTAGSQKSEVSTAVTIADNTWHCVAMTYSPPAANETQGQLQLYVNGKLGANLAMAASLGGGDAWLGCRAGTSEKFEGSMRSVRMYDTVVKGSDLCPGNCWIRMPTGCAKNLTETTTPTMWFVDPDNKGVSCQASRLAEFNTICERTDAVNHWGTTPGESCGARSERMSF